MRVLLLSRYGRLGASSRVRYYQFLPGLAEHGVEVDVSAFFDDGYLQRLYDRLPLQPTHLAAAYARRLLVMLRARRYDLLWIEKEILPWLPAGLERVLRWLRVPYIVDYDDATFHAYDLHRSRLVRAALGEKIDAVMRNAVLVTAGNAYLAERARRAGACRVEVVPTVVDMDSYAPRGERIDGSFAIGWIGSPSTAKYLRIVAPSLAEVCRAGGARLVVVGAQDPGLAGVPVEIRPWSEGGETEEIRRFDVGIMPLENGPWEWGKCGYKLVQ
jgi:glycosyltransferase involved in cell wall biosynthesis